MRRTKRFYVNGIEYVVQHDREIKDIMSSKLGIRMNIAPYTEHKANQDHNEIERKVIDGYELIFVEYEVMSFSFDTMNVSKPYMQKSVWFQKIDE